MNVLIFGEEFLFFTTFYVRFPQKFPRECRLRLKFDLRIVKYLGLGYMNQSRETSRGLISFHSTSGTIRQPLVLFCETQNESGT